MHRDATITNDLRPSRLLGSAKGVRPACSVGRVPPAESCRMTKDAMRGGGRLQAACTASKVGMERPECLRPWDMKQKGLDRDTFTKQL